MEGIVIRKRSKSEADSSFDFHERFQGRMHKVGKGGLMELFFPKIAKDACSNSRTSNDGGKRKIHSSLS